MDLTVVPFNIVFYNQAPDECSLQLSKALKQVVDMTGALLDRPIKLEPYMSQNFMGFFVAEDDANYLKRLALQYVKEVSNSSRPLLLIAILLLVAVFSCSCTLFWVSIRTIYLVNFGMAWLMVLFSSYLIACIH